DGHPGSGAPLCADREKELYSCQRWIDESRGSIGVDAEGVNHGRLPPLVWYLSKNNLSEVDAELESDTVIIGGALEMGCDHSRLVETLLPWLGVLRMFSVQIRALK
ncbi:hypothetical protein KUCAC02_008059, partial [Chaenocephalus aceratus]